MARKLAKQIHLPKYTKKKSQMINKMKKDLDIEDRKNQTSCLHTSSNGVPDVIIESRKDKNKDGQQVDDQEDNNVRGNHRGEVIFRCKNCNKRMLVNKIDERKLSECVRFLDCAVDTIKMKLDINKNNDLKCANWISPFQYHLLYQIIPLYGVTQRNEKDYKYAVASAYGHGEVRRKRR